MAQGHKIRASFGCLVLLGISLCIVDASESPFGTTSSSTTTTTTTTTTPTTTQVPVESSTSKPILSGNNETLAHTHDNLNGTEEHDHQHNTLPDLALQSDKLSSHGRSDAQSLSSTIIIIGLTLGTFVI